MDLMTGRSLGEGENGGEGRRRRTRTCSQGRWAGIAGINSPTGSDSRRWCLLLLRVVPSAGAGGARSGSAVMWLGRDRLLGIGPDLG